VGFSNLLTGELPLSDVRIRLADQGFDIITSGPLPPNPALLLSSGLQSQIDALMADYDLVILDGPPVMGLADAPLLADVAEATVLVIEARRSRRGAIRSALRRLGDARGMLAGVVLTKFSSRDAGYGGYYYSSYYSYGQPSS
jgi:polysaccharide biosynthesis transport protein